MTTHIMALTYAPKIEAVKQGYCRQTVRLLNKGDDSNTRKRLKHRGDEILIYTRVPPRSRYSKWDWRGRFVLTEILEIWCDINGIWRWSPLDERISNDPDALWPIIDDDTLLDIVRRDHIDPPTFEEWERVLMRLNNLKTLRDTEWEIIRWGPFEGGP